MAAGTVTADRPGAALAWAAAVVGTAYALVSAYWGLGGTRLLDTVGGALEREGRAGNQLLLAVVWLSVLLKLAAAALGVAVVVLRLPLRRLTTFAAWTAAVILTAYGGVLTLAGLLVQANVIHASADADHRALAWHAYFWDPWFLLWGVLLTAALRRSRTARAIDAQR